MMTTEDLIRQLALAAEPAAKGPAAVRRFAAPLAIGLGVALGVVVLALGLAPPGAAVRALGFWLKLGYGMAAGVAGVALAARLSRPGAAIPPVLAWAAPVLVVLVIGAGLAELAGAPTADRMSLMRGQSWMICPWLILAVAAPVYTGAIFAMRALAPTRPAVAGAAAGLAAGGLGAALYGLHCPEYAPAFIALWYTGGIALSTALGALIGTRALRW